jgi:hypothetical protein
MADDNVGYGRPPKSSQFKPGQSGNPAGRRPRFGNFEADLLEELNAEITIREGGVEHKISKQRAIVNALVAAAISGNLKASVALLGIFARSSAARDHDPDVESDENDDELVKRFKQRQLRSGSRKRASRSSGNEG